MSLVISYIAFGIAFIVASVTDIKTKKIPIYLFPTAAVVSIITQVVFKELYIVQSLISFGITFIVLLVFAVIGKGGGGDVIMISCTALVFYFVHTVVALVFSAIAYLIVGIVYSVIKNKPICKVRMAYAPFFAGGFLIASLMGGTIYV